MRKTVLILLLLIAVSFSVNAATPVKFMGIPVQGSIYEMEKKLENNGFVKYGNYFQGYYNDDFVYVTILGKKGIVCGIAVWYKFRFLEDVKFKYNKLYSQIIMKNDYYYIEGRTITMDDLILARDNKGLDLASVFYQRMSTSERPADCKSRRIELSVNTPLKGSEWWAVSLAFANMDAISSVH